MTFKERFEKRYAQSFRYQALDFQASTSVFDVQRINFKDDILATVIGVNEDKDVVDDGRQLMKSHHFVMIQWTERELLKRGYDSTILLCKLPKKVTIQVPKYMGGTTTPDFVYVVEREDESHVYLLVETKAEGSENDSAMNKWSDSGTFLWHVKRTWDWVSRSYNGWSSLCEAKKGGEITWQLIWWI